MKKTLCSVFLFLYSLTVFSQKAKNQSILVDTHNDFLSISVDEKVSFDKDLRSKTYSDLNRMFEGGVNVQFFSIFCDDNYGKGSAFNYANREIDSLYAVCARNPDRMSLVSDWKSLSLALKQHKLAAMLGVEGGHMIEDDLNKLDSFSKRGVRYMTLTWNNSTSWASSARDESDHAFVVTPYGLTTFGKDVVRRMNELGMMVDISHVGEKTFWDVINTTTKPVIASHSSVYALCSVFRNLKDDQIKAIAKNKGVIQVNFYSGFLDSTFARRLSSFFASHQPELDSLQKIKTPDYRVKNYFSKKYPKEAEALRPPLSIILDHIDYIVKLVGVDYVGLGSDFDGIDSAPKGLDGVQDYPKIATGLRERGYSEKDIDKILGGNLLRVFRANGN
ncbi:MAG: membrane dipeptidase [Bacteroidetes bacterium]|nr:MAG: membrane dipeptidase [Bacteroidota bacterium]